MKSLQNLFKASNNIFEKKQEVKISDFNSVDDFWKFITKKDEWYLEYLPQNFQDLKQNIEKLIPLIIETTNNFRYNLNFKQDDYWRIIQWDNLVFDNELEYKLKQFCSNCKNEITIMQRYPKSICHQCKNELKSSDGRKVEFFNSEALGYGCQGYYSNTNQTEKYNLNECYIGNKTFVADEGRFGGIIIELKE